MSAEWLTTREAAQILCCSERTVVLYLKHGELAGDKHGKSWRVSRDSVERRREGRPPAAPSERPPALPAATPPAGRGLGEKGRGGGGAVLTREALLSWPVLVAAYERARRGKRRSAPAVAWFRDWETRLLRLRERLEAGYVFGPYRTFLVRDPKPRDVTAAPFADRIVHHAIVSLIGPALERRMVPTSFACREGLGGAAAREALLRACRGGNARYYLKCDVRRYFPSMRHEVLRRALDPVAGDAFGADLLAALLDSWHTPGAPGTGIPIGNLTSQLFANVYLSGVDQFMLRTARARGYLRYVDDILWFGPEKEGLWEQLRLLEGRLLPLGLVLHPKKVRLGRVEDGVDFIGLVASKGWLRLRGATKRRGLRHLREVRRRFRHGEVPRARYLLRMQAFCALYEGAGARGLLAARGLRW